MPKFVDQASNSDKNTVSERQIQLNTVDPVEEKAKQTNPEAQNPNLNTSDLWRG